MQRFQQASFNSFVVDNDILGFFEKPITLKSGRQSNWYVNWRRVANDTFLLHELAHFVVQFLEDRIADGEIGHPDCLYGVPEGATKLGIITQYLWASMDPKFGPGSHVLAMGRAKPKEHGAPEDKYFVGMPRGLTVVLEDVTTTGGSLLTTIDQLLEAGVPIAAAIGLTNRMELRDDRTTVQQAIASRSSQGKAIPYFHMSDALTILPLVLKKNPPPQSTIDSITAEFKEFGAAQIKW